MIYTQRCTIVNSNVRIDRNIIHEFISPTQYKNRPIYFGLIFIACVFPSWLVNREISHLPCMQVRLTGCLCSLYEENAKQTSWLKASKGGETIHGWDRFAEVKYRDLLNSYTGTLSGSVVRILSLLPISLGRGLSARKPCSPSAIKYDRNRKAPKSSSKSTWRLQQKANCISKDALQEEMEKESLREECIG